MEPEPSGPGMDGAPSSRGVLFALGAILLGTALLSSWGLRWGLPHEHLPHRSFHPDEAFLFRGLAEIRDGAVQPRGCPEYGGTYFYAYGAWLLALDACGVVDIHLPERSYLSDAQASAPLFLASRCLSVAWSVAAVALTYAIGRELFGSRAGLLGAGLFALAPLRAVHAHFATVDSMLSCLVALSLWAGSRALRANGPWPAWAALLAGWASGTKAYAIFALLPVLHGLWAHTPGAVASARLGTLLRDRRLWGALGCVAAGFLAANPSFLIEPVAAARRLLDVIVCHAAGAGFTEGAREGSGAVRYLVSVLPYAWGPPLLVLSLAGCLCGSIRREGRLLLSFIVPTFVALSLVRVQWARYTLVLLPACCVLAAAFVEGWARSLRGGAARGVWVAAVAASAAYTGCYAWAYVRLFAQEDPRTEASRWILDHLGARDGIHVVLHPDYGPVPPSGPYPKRSRHFCYPPVVYVPETSARLVGVLPRVNAIDIRMTPEDLDQARERYLIVTNYELGAASRAATGSLEFVQRLWNSPRWRIEHVFRRELEFLHLPYLRRHVPHTMDYHFPALYLFRRVDPADSPAR